jgi:hypothetical protein
MNIATLSNGFMPMQGFCLDRLLKQRSALRESSSPSVLPPQRGGIRSLSDRAVCFATAITNLFRTSIRDPTNS